MWHIWKTRLAMFPIWLRFYLLIWTVTSQASCPSGWSVCHNFLAGRQGNYFQPSYRSICFLCFTNFQPDRKEPLFWGQCRQYVQMWRFSNCFKNFPSSINSINSVGFRGCVIPPRIFWNHWNNFSRLFDPYTLRKSKRPEDADPWCRRYVINVWIVHG